MFPIYGRSSGFTYDGLGEVRLDPLRLSLSSIVTAALVLVVALAASGQPPAQAEIPGDDVAVVATLAVGDPEAVVAAP